MTEMGTSPARATDGQGRLPPNRTYVVCASPRTGSTLLCSGLTKTGLAGFPRENFDDRLEIDAQYKNRLGVDDDVSYLRKVLRLSRTPNGMRGLKIHWHQLRVLERMLRAANEAFREAGGDIDFFDMQRRLFGPVRWIWLRRRDKVAQAVSLYRASRSNLWHHPATKERECADEGVQYDFKLIDMLVHRCFVYDTNWAKYLGANGIDALEIWYEDLSEDYSGTMASVLRYLDIPNADVGPPRMKKLAGATSLDWVERFKKEKAASVLGGARFPKIPLISYYGQVAMNGSI